MKTAAVLALGFALRVAIILLNPIIFGGDTIIRLADRYTLLKGHQLPMLQFFIAAASLISMDPVLIRYMMTLIGAIAGVAFYWVAEDLFGEEYAFPAALLFATNPFLVALSTVPFQEILMLAALLFAFHFFYRERWAASSVCLAIACLTRYEAWAACPVFAAVFILRNYRSPLQWLKAFVLFGWMPVVWVLAHGNLTSPGHFVVERSITIWRLQRYVYLGWITAKFTQITVLALALAGIWRLWRKPISLDWRVGTLLVFVALFLISIPFSAHGVSPDPERYVTSREACIPILFVLLLAAAGLPQWPRWRAAIVAVSIALGAAGAYYYVRQETSKPEIQVAWRTARSLDGMVAGNERVLVLAPPVSEETSRSYLDKARETGGEKGFEAARLELQHSMASPPDYQRLLVYSRLRPSQLVLPPAACADWSAVWNDAPQAAPQIASGRLVEQIRSGPMSVNILRGICQ